jgi:signal transduction histidine kinase
LSLKLTHKALILVLVPLLVELAILGALRVLLKQSEEATRRESHSREIADCLNELSRHFADAGGAVLIYRFSKSRAFAERFRNTLNEIPVEFKRLETLADTPKRKENVAKIELLGNRLLGLLNQYYRTVEEGGVFTFLDIENLRKESEAILSRYSETSGKFVEQEREMEKGSPLDEARLRAILKQGIVWASILNISLAAALTYFFNKNTSARLNTLMDNTQRFASGKSLNEAVAGSDEIAQLDKVFHAMVDKLSEAARQKQEFVSMMSHDLRSPLASLQVTLAVLLRGQYGSLNETGIERARSAESSVNRLINMISELLEFEKISSGAFDLRLELVSIRELAQLAGDAVCDLAQQLGVELDLAPDNLKAVADKKRIVQVLINLLANAVRHSSRGEKVSVRAETSGDTVLVKVLDNGPGVPSQFKEKIFERFQQVQKSTIEAGQGSGLGLAICKAIVERHGGQIGVEDNKSHGSVFWFTLKSGDEGAGNEENSALK